MSEVSSLIVMIMSGSGVGVGRGRLLGRKCLSEGGMWEQSGTESHVIFPVIPRLLL